MTTIEVIALLSFLHLFCPILAIDLGAPIVGCSEVDCPTSFNTTVVECKVADRTLSVIGLANFKTPVAADDFTWTEGIQIYENIGPRVYNDRIYEKNFYLGTPRGFDLIENATASNYEVCALFFTELFRSVTFDGGQNATSIGTCSDALSSACVDALLKQATDVARSYPFQSGLCSKLLWEFNHHRVPQCSNISTARKWAGLMMQDLTGSKAPKPFTDAENSTSNCYPTLPKSNSLTRVVSFNTTGTTHPASLIKHLYSIVPILTLFLPQNENSSTLLKQPEARLTCLKGTGLTDAEMATIDKNGNNAAGLGAFPKLIALVSAIYFSLFVLA